MPSDPDNPRPHGHRNFGFIAMAIGGLTALMIYFNPQKLNAPAWVAYAACAAFVFAGLSIVAQDSKLRPLRDWFAAAMVLMMFLIPAWIALGPGDRQCSMSIDIFAGATSDIACRVVFGIAALFTAAILIWMLVTVKSRSRP